MKKHSQLLESVGAVVIGRNEGSRLNRCLKSLQRELSIIFYVDSGSSDNSVEMANGLGVEVIALDMNRPFTAARARNEGWLALIRRYPQITCVQFVDGDCEVVDGWLVAAYRQLSDRPELAVVCGRRRERFPDATIYNKLCDIEWDTPIGESTACGGDAMIRVEALAAVNGFDARLVAGEEPELCVRLRERGWRVFRLDIDMTLHDAALTSFSQWFRRASRAGHAFAEGAHMHGRSPSRHWVKESRRVIWWGGLVPLLAIGGIPLTSGWSLFLFLGYPLSAVRAYQSARKRNRIAKDSIVYGLFCTIGKFPEFIGACRFHLNRIRNKQTLLIEYKDINSQ